MKPLQQIIDRISQEKFINSSRVVEIVKKASVSSSDLLPYANFHHPLNESYGRAKIFEGENFGVYVMSWNPGDFTAIHSHGHTQWGAVLFLSNTNHRIYTAKDKSVKLIDDQTICAGSLIPIREGFVHAMGNLSNEPFQSLHIYGASNYSSPTNTDSLVYQLEYERMRITDGRAFINIDDSYAKKDIPGLVADDETMMDYLQIIRPFYQRAGDYEMVNHLDCLITLKEPNNKNICP